MQKSREANKRWFDAHNRKRPASQEINVGDLVLLHNTRLDKQHTDKLKDRWLGPYRVVEITKHGTHVLEELDGTPMCGTAPPDRVKKFYPREYGGIGVEKGDEGDDENSNEGDDVGSDVEEVETSDEEQIEEEGSDSDSVIDGKRVRPRKD